MFAQRQCRESGSSFGRATSPGLSGFTRTAFFVSVAVAVAVAASISTAPAVRRVRPTTIVRANRDVPRREASNMERLKVGVQNTTGWGVDAIFYTAGIRYERLDVGDGRNLSVIAKALRDRITPLVLYNAGSGGLHGVSPSQAAADVVSMARRLNSLAARHPIMNKLHAIEFGNEVYVDENVATYAAQYDAAHRALAANGLPSWKLLAVATAVCGIYHAQNWIPDFIRDISGGAAEVDGWTVHPYGPLNSDTTPECKGPQWVLCGATGPSGRRPAFNELAQMNNMHGSSSARRCGPARERRGRECRHVRPDSMALIAAPRTWSDAATDFTPEPLLIHYRTS